MTKHEQTEARQRHLSSITNTKAVERRPYQARIGESLAGGWRDGVVSQLIVSPTGAGKTVMGLEAARDFVAEAGPELFGCAPEEVGVVWVAMRGNLLTQTEEENHRLFVDGNKGSEVICPNIVYLSMFSGNPKAGLERFKRILMVVDEAHHDAASTMINLHATVRPDRVLGLSATPQRSDSMKICFQREVRDAGYRFLIRDGYLAQFDHHVMQQWGPREAAALYLSDPGKWGKTLAFFRTRAECDEFVGVLVEEGVRAEVVHGKSDRERQLDDLRASRMQVAASMILLAEGLDCPSLNTVMVRDTHSPGPVIQMSGRVLRLWEGRVKHIVQSAAAKYPFTRFAKARLQFREGDDGWVEVGNTDLADRMVAHVTRRMMKAEAPKLPDILRRKSSSALAGLMASSAVDAMAEGATPRGY